MTNRYAQMDAEDAEDAPPKKPAAKAKSKNRYAEMDAEETAAPKKPAPKTYTMGEAAVTGLKNMGKGAVEFGTTVKDAYLGLQDPKDMVNKAAGFAVTIPGAVGNLAGSVYAKFLPPEVQKQLAAAKPEMIGGADAVVKDYIERYGGWEAAKRGIAEHPYKFLNDVVSVATLPAGGGTTVAGRAASAVAARTPGQVTRLAQSLPAKAAGVVAKGVVAPTQLVNDASQFVAGRVIPTVARRGSNAMNPKLETISQAGEGRLGQIHNALAAPPAARQIVPGSVPTAGQVVAQSVNAPRFVALANDAAKRMPAPARDVKDAQNTARLEQIRRIGGGPLENYDIFGGNAVTDVMQGMSLRDAQATQGYGAANRVISSGDDELIDILNSDFADIAQNNARMVANEENTPFNFGNDLPARRVADPYGQHGVPDQELPAEYAQHNGRSLQLLKEAYDKLAYDKPTQLIHGIDASKAQAIITRRNQLVNWISRNNQPWDQARQRYALQSGVIGRMQLRDGLEGILTKELTGDYTPDLRAADFARAIADDTVHMNSAVTRSTGRKLHQRLDQMVPPREYEMITGVRDDLGRAAEAMSQAADGAPSVPDLESAFTTQLGFNPDNKFVKPFTSGIDDRIANEMSQSFQTPEGAAELVRNAMLRDMDISQWDQRYNWLLNTDSYNPLRSPNTFNPFRLGNRFPAAFNAMAAQQNTQPQ